ncbi:Sir2 family NAD+-dependent deacetylase [Endozoicomonas numazuensis]|uniref:NAD-dependent protein deacylase n=1 Tax=Endozoicomonas numazuensis TaxID=1137799 RepID=A0A081NH19_9GAMM|nr:Sir2 family NAD+-dependent deacetylase [Endozoicomonas numazuensis]KEQ17742.1 NAD-dependent deacetylase [Endozoicomonas numazuensis]
MPRYQSIVVLTGAGISAESGIRTFRASDGLWENHPVEEVATPEGYYRNPALVQSFYNGRRQQLSEVVCNDAHKALSDFEKAFDGDFLLVTQNVDDLHSRAGSQNLIHMHGELYKARCQDTEQVFDWHEDLTTQTLCPCCKQAGNLRPNIVWFGEMPLEMNRIYEALSQCDLFVSIGTSGNVYPAAGFFAEAKAAGAETVELNLEPGSNASQFDRSLTGHATELVPDFFNALLG